MQAKMPSAAGGGQPQVPTKVQGFALHAPSTATCSSALVHPWQIGSWTNTDLNPFDNVNLLGKEASDVRWCGQRKPGSDGGAAGDSLRVVPCSDCPNGYSVGEHDRGPLMCRDPPVPSADGTCSSCTQSVLTPWVVGDCKACISFGVNAMNGSCSCNEF